MPDKVIDACSGDEWTRWGPRSLLQHRDGRERGVWPNVVGIWGRSMSKPDGAFLTAAQAHAILQEWGYEVSGDMQRREAE